MADDEKSVFGFSRRLGEEAIWVVLNNSDVPQTVTLPFSTRTRFTDLLNGGELLSTDGRLRLDIAPRWGRVLSTGRQ